MLFNGKLFKERFVWSKLSDKLIIADAWLLLCAVLSWPPRSHGYPLRGYCVLNRTWGTSLSFPWFKEASSTSMGNIRERQRTSRRLSPDGVEICLRCQFGGLFPSSALVSRLLGPGLLPTWPSPVDSHFAFPCKVMNTHGAPNSLLFWKKQT